MADINIIRATKLTTASLRGRQHLLEVEQEVAAEVLSPSVLERDSICRTYRCSEFADCSDFEVTRQVGLTMGLLVGNVAKYDIYMCSDRVFCGLWGLRQIIDQTGINYGVYVGVAIEFVRSKGGRISPAALSKPAVVAHVLKQWAAHEVDVGRGSKGEVATDVIGARA